MPSAGCRVQGNLTEVTADKHSVQHAHASKIAHAGTPAALVMLPVTDCGRHWQCRQFEVQFGSVD